ncbi:MAG: tetratricopeptide repeat protein [Candidatus Latescibacteria bacterium]|nr:tetratricopeptide repeat protein [Candidatus Latescibacterota bacterium]
MLVSYALNYALGGQGVRGYRWFNLFLHVLCATLLCAWLCHAVDWQAAWIAGLVFLVHPIHAELVNYLSSRSDLVVSCWYLGAMLLVAQGRWGGTCAAYAGGLLSKEVAITLPLLAGLQQGWNQVRKSWRPYLVLGAIGLGYLALISLNRFLPGSLAKAPRGWGEQVLTQLKAYVYYVWLFCMPVRLSVEHQFFVSSGLDAPVVLSALLLASLGGLAWRQLRHLPAYGWIWFALTLAPASLVPLNILISERRMYLASAGLCLVVAWLWQRAGVGRRTWLVAAVLGGLLTAMSVARNQVWASEVGLWEDAVAKGPEMFRARANLALAYKHEGRDEEALVQLRKALQLKPDYADAWAELGNLLFDQGDGQGAEEAYTQALRFNPSLEGVHYNLGNVAQGRGEWEAAIAHYQDALRCNPRYAEARNNMGQAFEAQGRRIEALAEYRQALALNPELAQAWYNLAVALEREGEAQEAGAAYRRCRTLLLADPEYQENALYQEFARRAQEAAQRLGGN